jgi:hypothetical protein
MRHVGITIAAAQLVFLPALPAAGQVPDAISYQGVLVEGSVAVNDTVDITIRLYDSLSGGALLYEETDAALPVTDGVFTMTLGDNPSPASPASALSSALNASAPVFLEVDALGGPFSPRQQILSSPYSINTRGVFVDELGDVGLGTSAPGARLDVDGDVPASGDFRYSTSREYVKHVPVAAFNENGNDDLHPSWNRVQDYISLYVTPSSLSLGFSAPIDLPDGATVIETILYGYDDDPTYDMTLTLAYFRRDLTSTTISQVGSAYQLTTSGASTAIQSESRTPIANPVIDNQNYSYYLNVGMQVGHVTNDLRFYGVRIRYTIDQLGP